MSQNPTPTGVEKEKTGIIKKSGILEILNFPNPKYFGDIIQNISEGICEINDLNIITFCNQSFASIFERIPNEMIGKNFLNFVGSDNRVKIKEELEINYLSLNSSFEMKLKIANQQDKIIQVRLFPMLSNNNKHLGTLLILSDITDRLLIEKDLLLTKEKAKETDNLKASFLANVPHEIRTPMNCIMGFASILKRSGLTKKKRNQYLDFIISHGNKLMDILNDIIDLTIIEEKHLQLNITACNLNEIFSDVFRTSSQAVKKLNKSIKIKYKPDLSDEKSVMLIDGDRIIQILRKLVNNSMKFTENGFIELGYRFENKETIVCYVKDTGIGIPPEFHNTIFEQFRQVDESFTRNYGGTGVGLTICHGLVKLLGGNMWVESDGIHGTTIYFTFPYFPFKEYEKPVKSKILNIAIADWEGKKILLIEDDPASSEYLTEILLSKNCKVINANNGIMALDCYKSDMSINIILLDIQLPDLDGYAIAKEIRKLNSSVPIIAQTAHARVEDKKKCYEAGCNEYLAKPIPYELFLDTVQKYL